MARNGPDCAGHVDLSNDGSVERGLGRCRERSEVEGARYGKRTTQRHRGHGERGEEGVGAIEERRRVARTPNTLVVARASA